MNFVLTAQGWPQRAGHECRRLAQDGRSDGSVRQCAVLAYGAAIEVRPADRPCYKERLVSRDDRPHRHMQHVTHTCAKEAHTLPQQLPYTPPAF
jgi:hypothetical protein